MAHLHLSPLGSPLDVRPTICRPGDVVRIAFRVMRVPGALALPRYDVSVLDTRRLRVATLLREAVRPTGGVVFVDWDGRDDRGQRLRPGSYLLRVAGLDHALELERTLVVEA